MANLQGEETLEEVDEGNEEELGSRSHCLSCFCLLCALGKPERIGYRSLPREDCAKGKCWGGGGQRSKELLVESMARLRWRRALANEMRSRNKIKRRKPGLTYDSRSYKLNFDDGPDCC